MARLRPASGAHERLDPIGTGSVTHPPDAPPAPFSDEEMVRRRRVLDEELERSGLDVVVLYGANRSGSAVQWLTGWPVTRSAAVVHRRGERDLLFVQHFNHVPQAQRLAREAEVSWGGPDLAALLTVATARDARVGLVGAVPARLHQALAAGAELVDLSGAYTRIRTRKSAEELTWLRHAARLTDASCVALRDGASVGSTEYELGALVESSYLAAGGTNHIHYFAVTAMDEPRQCVPSQWPGPRALAAGDVVSCELSTAWGVDYPGQLLRTFTVAADPTPLYAELHAVAEAALDRVEAVLRAGTTAEEIVEAASVIEEAGFTTVDDLVHGLGGGYLPPVIGSRSRTLQPLPTTDLEAGMTVVVQPNVVLADRSAGVQTGEMFHVTESGSERLHAFPRGLGRIA